MRYFYIFLICIIASGCKNSKSAGNLNTIDLASNVGKGEVVNLSEVANDIRYVKLETNESSLIGRFPKAYYENERIYVITAQVIRVFDINGKFLFKFDRRGRGPEEYINVGNFLFLPGTDNIVVYNHGFGSNSKLLYYDNNGMFIRSKEIPRSANLSSEKVIILNNSMYINSLHLLNRDSATYNAIVYDSCFNVVKRVPTPYLPEYERKTVMSMAKRDYDGSVTMINAGSYFSIHPPQMYNFNDKVRFLINGNDTIFSMDSKLNYTPAFTVNYGKYKNQSSNREKILSTSGGHISMGTSYFIESEEYLVLKFNLREYCHETHEIIYTITKEPRVVKYTDTYALFNKKTGKFTLLNQPVKNMLGFREDIKNGPPFLPATISSDFRACAVYTASQIIDYAKKNEAKGELKEIVKGLRDTDNPIVAIARMK